MNTTRLRYQLEDSDRDDLISELVTYFGQDGGQLSCELIYPDSELVEMLIDFHSQP